MAEITAAVVKELRERTGAGMMDCKKALAQTAGDMEKAVEFLREKGLAAAAKKSGRVAAEGMVHAYLSSDKKVGVLLEVNCETDFVAKNPDFQKFVQETSQLIAVQNPADVAALGALELSEGKKVSEVLTALVATIGENMTVRRFVRFAAANGQVDSYIHMGGKIGVLVEAAYQKAETANSAEFGSLMRDLAMQVAAAKPEYTNRNEVPSEVLEGEKTIYKAQAMNEGKPEAIAEKIMTGRLEKFYKEICLTEQIFIKDTDKTVTKLLQEVSGKLDGEVLQIVRFVRFEKGEGLEKKQDDFVNEVMSQINN